MQQVQQDNPAHERVSQQRETLAAQHRSSEPSPLVKQQVAEAKAREQSLDEQKAKTSQQDVAPAPRA
ncbi:hypothetical protein PP724_22970 [Ralstonia solanacearum]|uniref:hypothetical protein n=1 Tax=Ralstonia solanacearum TaxID=305 RepID=UPI001FFB3270|nr:hypothetical protein [Ralstonia solanacearum]MDC6237030.1 hypothetical protein [Ralstonia solanacearum]MDD7810567.1 hypothetical protein [Ralstonia solanacearum]